MGNEKGAKFKRSEYCDVFSEREECDELAAKTDSAGAIGGLHEFDSRQSAADCRWQRVDGANAAIFVENRGRIEENDEGELTDDASESA